jgi:hypothetical protein
LLRAQADVEEATVNNGVSKHHFLLAEMFVHVSHVPSEFGRAPDTRS